MSIFGKQDANVCYEKTGNGPDPRLGIAVRGSIPLRKMRLTNYDVSVKDIYMSGVLESVIEELDILERLKCKNIFVTNRYSSVKIWINRSSKELNAAVACPFANAVVNNFASLALKGATAGFTATTLPVIQGALTPSLGADNAKLVTDVAGKLIEKGNTTSPVGKNKSSAGSDWKGIAKDAMALASNTKAAVSKKDCDITFVGMSVQTPKFRDQKKRLNVVRRLIHNAKSRLFPDKLIVRVGSEFNKHHAGCVIDLGVRAISIHDLIMFLSIYAEQGKLLNCFHDVSSSDEVAGKVNII
ncbi:hypothetical protein [Photobacterium lipolyticum]|uniref:Uncharacterized protein n=1 Tax=Photobacterium lipolyticum TaxID=266810 RepID=A0A2T3N0E0_9GAMM|nr:hypothetical protein [Photobacterium lipolyticum]PSW05698.1 hypothetical protein C9I89_08105 [Photobacterium lipolyticum]